MVRGADGSLDLGATLEALNERLPDPADIDARNDAIQRLFGDEGKRGLVPLLADLDKYRDGLQAVGQSEGVVNQSIQRFLDSSGGQWQMLTQNLTAVGAVLGGTMLPLVNSILTPMADLAGWVGGLVERFPQLGHAVGAAGLALTAFGGAWAAAAWFGKGQQFLGFAQGAAKGLGSGRTRPAARALEQHPEQDRRPTGADARPRRPGAPHRRRGSPLPSRARGKRQSVTMKGSAKPRARNPRRSASAPGRRTACKASFL